MWGLALQFIFALIILRWDWGYNAFKWLGDRVAEFLGHTTEGAKFVFGDEYYRHFFAFGVSHQHVKGNRETFCNLFFPNLCDFQTKIYTFWQETYAYK